MALTSALASKPLPESPKKPASLQYDLLEQSIDACLQSAREQLLRELPGILVGSFSSSSGNSTSSTPVANNKSTVTSSSPIRRQTTIKTNGTKFDMVPTESFASRRVAQRLSNLLSSQDAGPSTFMSKTSFSTTSLPKSKLFRDSFANLAENRDRIDGVTRANDDFGDRGSESFQVRQILNKARKVNDRRTIRHVFRRRLPFHKRMQLRARELEPSIDIVMAVIIVLNVLQLGISTDLAPLWRGWLYVDTFFACAFTVEFLLKVWMHGPAVYLCGKMWAWGAFDVFIVVNSLFEIIFCWVMLANDSDEDMTILGVSFFRLVRLGRVSRILKVIRFPIFKDLVAMIDGLIYGTRTLFWSLILLFTPIYACAILMRETIDYKEDDHDVSKPFSTFFWSFFTCFRCIMGDCSAETGQPLSVLITDRYGWYYGAGFVVVVVVTAFGLFNVIIAIYIGNITTAAKRNETQGFQIRLSDMDRYNYWMAQLIHLFVTAAQEDALGHTPSDWSCADERMTAEAATCLSVKRETFEEMIHTEEVNRIFNELDLLPENRLGLFETLDADGGDSLSIGEILNGLSMLRGEPRRADTIANGLMLRSFQCKYATDTRFVKDVLNELKHELLTLKDELVVLVQKSVRDYYTASI